MAKRGIIADSIHGNIELTNLERKVLSHVMFNRLHDVYQNSTVYMTFPCNRTKRFEHSIGTMHLCSNIFYNSIKNANPEHAKNFFVHYEDKLNKSIPNLALDKFANKFGERLEKLRTAKIPKIPKEFDNFFNMPKNALDHQSTYVILHEAIRVAALLHDIGHPPYSHVAEFALEDVKEIISGITDKTPKMNEFIKIMNSFNGTGSQKLHEQMGNRISERILRDSVDNIDESDSSNAKIYNKQLFEVLIVRTACDIFTEKDFEDIHAIIDGSLDGDRLDYSSRDAYNSGLKKGTIEYDRLFSSMKLVQADITSAKTNKEERNYLFCPSIKVVNTVEDFLERRWGIYKNIIFHHHAVKTDYLMQNVITNISIAYLKDKLNKDMPEEDNEAAATMEVGIPAKEVAEIAEEKYSDLLPNDISGLWKALKPISGVESSYAISQWDDSWLLTVLKKHFFSNYIGNPDNYLTKQLKELLMNKRYYISVIKRLEDFLIIDKAILNELMSNKEIIDCKIKSLQNLSDKESGSSPKVPIDPFLKDVASVFYSATENYENDSNTFQGLIFNSIKILYSIKPFGLNPAIKESVNKSKEALGNSIEDVVCVIKKYNNGLTKPIMFHSQKKNSENVVSIHEISSIRNVLNLGYNTFPQFYIYILPKKYERNLDLDKFLNRVGVEIAKNAVNLIITTLDNQIDIYKNIKQEG